MPVLDAQPRDHTQADNIGIAVGIADAGKGIENLLIGYLRHLIPAPHGYVSLRGSLSIHGGSIVSGPSGGYFAASVGADVAPRINQAYIAASELRAYIVLIYINSAPLAFYRNVRSCTTKVRKDAQLRIGF
ncbi:MAG: hypothetical protein ACXW3X_17900 [Rhodoplanes sp.]